MHWWSADTPYLHIFDGSHWLYLFVIVGTLITLLLNHRNVKAKRKQIASIILTISILQQVVLYSWLLLEKGFAISDSLPLHISRVSSLLGIYFLLTKNTKALEILFYFGLFAYGSFAYPKQIYPAYHIMGISFVLNHIITVLLPYFAFIAYHWRPKFIGYLQAYFFFVLYLAVVYMVNPIVDGNYFYLTDRPFFQEWPDYLYIPILLVTVFCGYFVAFRLVEYIGRITSSGSKQLFSHDKYP